MQQQEKTASDNKLQNVINPTLNAKKVDTMALRAETVFIWVAIVITSIGFLVFGKEIAIKFGAPTWLAWIVGILAGGLSGYVTDYAFRHLLEEVVFQPLAWLHPGSSKAEQPLFFQVMGVVRWIFLTIIVSTLFIADWYSVQSIRDPFANQAQEKSMTDIVAFNADLSTQLSASATPLSEQIKALKTDITSAEKKVEQSNPGLLQLMKSGNGWATKELEKKKAKATKLLKSELSGITQSYNTAVSENTRMITAETQRVQQDNNNATNENATQRNSLSGLFFYSGAGSKALSVLLRIFLVISFLYKNPTLDANGDGVVDGKDVTDAAGGRPGF